LFTLAGVMAGRKTTYGGQFTADDKNLSMNVAQMNGTAAPSVVKISYRPSYKIIEGKLIISGGYAFDGEYSK